MTDTKQDGLSEADILQLAAEYEIGLLDSDGTLRSDWPDDRNMTQRVVAYTRAIEQKVLSRSTDAAQKKPHGLTMCGYSDEDEYMGDTLDEYVRQRGFGLGDSFDVTEGWSRERSFEIVGGGPTALDPKAPFEFKALDDFEAAAAQEGECQNAELLQVLQDVKDADIANWANRGGFALPTELCARIQALLQGDRATAKCSRCHASSVESCNAAGCFRLEAGNDAAQEGKKEAAALRNEGYDVVCDRRDLFDFLRAAWRDGQDHQGEMDERERWDRATQHATKAIQGWATLRHVHQEVPAVEAEQVIYRVQTIAPEGKQPLVFLTEDKSLAEAYLKAFMGSELVTYRPTHLATNAPVVPDWLNNFFECMKQKVFHECRGLMETANQGQDMALRLTLLHFAEFLSAAPAAGGGN